LSSSKWFLQIFLRKPCTHLFLLLHPAFYLNLRTKKNQQMH
jgi:hypothetical protein